MGQENKMSHPNPTHDRDREYPSDDYKPVGARSKALAKSKVKPFAKGVQGLKQMMNQPASKHWFNRLNK